MMRIDRRRLLQGLAVLPVLGAPAAALLQPRLRDGAAPRFIADARMPGARALAATARGQGLAFADPQGEIVTYFLGEGAAWLRTPGPIVGLTSYTDMMLMRDLARQAGRLLHHAAIDDRAGTPGDGLGPAQARLVATLRDAPAARGQPRAFVWLV